MNRTLGGILIALCLISFALVGCEKKTQAPQPAAQPAATPAPAPAPAPTPAPAPAPTPEPAKPAKK